MPLEKAMAGLEWTYDNAISQPISTFLLMSGQNQDVEDIGTFFKGSEWSRAWQAANHVSPGQALSSFYATDEKGFGDIVNGRPLYATPEAAYLPPGWAEMSEDEQQEMLREAGMPVIGNRAVEQLRRDHAWFTFASGATDFATRWWLDPVVLAGRAAGAAREKYIVKPRPRGGWGADDIDSIMADSTMGKAQDFLWRNKDNPALINNLTMFRKSALGPRAGGIISSLRSPEEVNLFLRTNSGNDDPTDPETWSTAAILMTTMPAWFLLAHSAPRVSSCSGCDCLGYDSRAGVSL